jgi:ATP-binding cassette subfamily B protein
MLKALSGFAGVPREIRRRFGAIARTSRISSLTLLLVYLRPYRRQAIGAGAALLAASAFLLALGQGVRRLIDLGFASDSAVHLNTAALGMFGVVSLLAVATFTRFYLISWLGERIAGDLRRDIFERVISLSPAFLETARTGDILTRLTSDISVLQTLIGSAISMWMRNAILLVGAFALLIATSPKLTALIVLVIPLVLLPLVVFGRRERRLSRAAQDRVADLGAYAEETINALRTVQAFTHEPLDRARFSAEIERAVAAATRRITSRATLLFSVIFLGFGAIIFSLWIGGRDVIAGRMSAGALSAFLFYAVVLAMAAAQMSELWGELQRAGGAADRLQELLQERPTIAAPGRPALLPARPEGRVRFDNVTFRYPARPEAAALANIDLEVHPGETVALVGPSGAGKTTVLQLLLRFYDPQKGIVRLDGIDISAVDPTELRKRMAIVPQDPVIFSTSAWENIRFGRPEASDAEIIAAAHAAHAAGFLTALPEGYQTFLGEKGVRLSGGQRQRIAIARAILRDPAVLLLDEATSALDAESEQAVQMAMAALSRGRTTIVIAHRLATVRSADRIVVLEAGRIVASGTHDALMREPGTYARLARLQFEITD